MMTGDNNYMQWQEHMIMHTTTRQWHSCWQGPTTITLTNADDSPPVLPMNIDNCPLPAPSSSNNNPPRPSTNSPKVTQQPCSNITCSKNLLPQPMSMTAHQHAIVGTIYIMKSWQLPWAILISYHKWNERIFISFTATTSFLHSDHFIPPQCLSYLYWLLFDSHGIFIIMT